VARIDVPEIVTIMPATDVVARGRSDCGASDPDEMKAPVIWAPAAWTLVGDVAVPRPQAAETRSASRETVAMTGRMFRVLFLRAVVGSLREQTVFRAQGPGGDVAK
jgi:hypothetical protein